MVENLYTLTLLKAFDILDCFENDVQEIGIKEIATAIGMPQSSVHRIIQSLEFVGLIFQNKETKKYRIGPKFVTFPGKQRRLNSYLQIVIRHMEELRAAVNETVNLAVLSCDKIIYIHRVECSHVLRPNFVLNASYPAFKTGLGMVLMSELSDASLQWIYQNNQKEIGTSFQEFADCIHRVRADGYAFDDQIFSPGLRCVAAPIKGPGGKALFSISVSAPILRMEDSVYLSTRELVTKCAAAASEEIQENSL